MKNLKKLICILITITIFIGTSISVSAHEFQKPLRWYPKSNGYAHLKISYSGLKSDSVYRNNLTTMRTAVNNSTAKILMNEASSGVNIDITSASGTAWLNYNMDNRVAALTVMYDTQSVRVYTYAGSAASNGEISYANILVNPLDCEIYDTNGKVLSDAMQTSVLIHEVGHALGLWHCACSSHTSVMKGISSISPTSYTSYDNSCLKSYYG